MTSFLEVRIGDNEHDEITKQNTLCYYYNATMPSGTTLTWQCFAPITGRYVSVQKVAGVAPKELVFCELKVFLSEGRVKHQSLSGFRKNL